ncbi:hypothetical protein E2562_014754 [Oryza meyeriana var. granulata]|uniref:Uncharacterized protein n=1 Tax=Oryza meyeriana var. granulata TaxID=110450 RepID=A0A6G1BLB5_9ORYZ|nr:hypothetical protein E2562_014754 [Oryza meyeriana var. granulata]
MAPDTKASGSSRPSYEEAPGVQEPGVGGAGPEARPAPGEGNAHNPLARKKAKMTSTPERHPLAGSPWGFTSPKPR